jgi:hypothetical protein
MTNNGHLWGAVATALSLLALWPVILWARERRRRFHRCEATVGRVISVDDDDGCKHLRYQFRAQDGVDWTGTSDYASSFIRQRAGDPVPVLYDPEEPSWSEINWWGAKYGAPALLLAILAPWLLAGMIKLVTGRSEWHEP